MTNQVSEVVAWVGLVVLLEVRDGESDVQIPDVLYGHHFVVLLWGETQNGSK